MELSLKDYDELFKEAVEWNYTLKDNTREMQLKKVWEECQELLEALDSKDNGRILEESADVFIATAGLGRFNIFEGQQQVVNFLVTSPDYILENLPEAIQMKLQIIKGRKYKKKKGVYKH